jgi:16S rRNA (cytosine1407-C5)-methyltransferase
LDLPHINGYVNINGHSFDESLELSKRIIPWEIKSEGFFIAKLKKIAPTEEVNTKFHVPRQKKIIVDAGNKQIKKYLDEISYHFGIEKSIFYQYKYLINDKDINFVSVDSNESDPSFFIRIGTKFGIIDKNDSLKLNSHAAQILGNHATKNIFELNNEDELSSYFSGGIIYLNSEHKGQKIVTYNKMILGTAVALKNQLKSQFPRSKRTGTISIN